MTYKLGISTCPNDTFMFHGILSGRVKVSGCTFDIELLDIQELNARTAQGDFHFSKVSCFAAARLSERFERCQVGAALGYGVGPLLLGRANCDVPLEEARILVPGRDTTAHLLLRTFYPAATNIQHVVFSDIMPALQQGDADYGVVIHEGRFTYQAAGLSLVADLGSLWEREFRVPLPLGCLVADRRIALRDRLAFSDAVKSSIVLAHSDREAAAVTMRRYAQELSDEVLWKHVALYVNQWSLELGDEGSRALHCFDKIVSDMPVV